MNIYTTIKSRYTANADIADMKTPEIILFGPDGTILARDLYGEGIGEKVAEYLNEE